MATNRHIGIKSYGTLHHSDVLSTGVIKLNVSELRKKSTSMFQLNTKRSQPRGDIDVSLQTANSSLEGGPKKMVLEPI